MTDVIAFPHTAPQQPASLAGVDDMPKKIEPRPAYSFDMFQAETRGMVLIDACVPTAVAIEFMRLLVESREIAPPLLPHLT